MIFFILVFFIKNITHESNLDKSCNNNADSIIQYCVSLLCTKKNERPENNVKKDIEEREIGRSISFHSRMINRRG